MVCACEFSSHSFLPFFARDKLGRCGYGRGLKSYHVIVSIRSFLKMESVYVLTLLLAVCSLSSVRGQPKCTPKEDNPCVCEGSNFTINLGAAFQAKTS